MAALPRLPSKLRNALGHDAAEDLVTILDDMRLQHAELQRQIREDFANFRSDFQAFEARQDARFAQVDARFAQVDACFDRIDIRFTELHSKVGDVKSDLMKWSFVFWCGAVAAVAALAGVLKP